MDPKDEQEEQGDKIRSSSGDQTYAEDAALNALLRTSRRRLQRIYL